MDMNRTFFLRKEDAKPQWQVIDAEGQILGRLATKLATMLRGKDKAIYTPHTKSGDYIVIINADKIKMTSDKIEHVEYAHYTGWIGGYKVRKAKDVNPEELIHLAVKRMLPKNKLSEQILRRLKIYKGSEHPHIAQVETTKQASKA